MSHPSPPFGPNNQNPRGSLPWVLGGVGALVVAAGIVVPIVLVGGDDTPAAAATGISANDVADRVVAAFNDRDAAALADTACDDVSALDRRKARKRMKMIDPARNPNVPPAMKQVKVGFERTGDARESGATASADIKVTFSNVPPEAQASIPTVVLRVEMKNDGGWCVTDVRSDSDDRTPSSGARPSAR